MHFSKTYAQLLLSLPPELRDSAIEYRKLKKLINQVVIELTSLGLSPEILHQVLLQTQSDLTGSSSAPESSIPWVSQEEGSLPRVIYEISTDSDQIQPRLRLLVDTPDGSSSSVALPNINLDPEKLRALITHGDEEECEAESETAKGKEVAHLNELIIPLVSDSAFFQMLQQALQHLSAHLLTVRQDFMANLSALSSAISSSARPMSSTSSSFHAYSNTTNPALVNVQTPSVFSGHHKSDLYAWREIFQLYVDMEVFESHNEKTRGERSTEDAEARLWGFYDRLKGLGYLEGKSLRLRESRGALQTFLDLNVFILNLKRFQFATTEATRKILKKHAKRTALPTAPDFIYSIQVLPEQSLALIPGQSLSLTLVQAVGETLLPIVPHIDDYGCVICTLIAFKPIRLVCGHLFCVRCLVKMQKRGEDKCPMCRAPTVLSADKRNVDWALLNFMQDWFPLEAKEKLQQSEREAAEDLAKEMGWQTEGCIIT